MKKISLLLFSPILCLVVTLSISGAAHSGESEESKLARYGQYGGPFTLIDHSGKTVTDRDFLGAYMLMFFGYTYCPDVCPTTMQVIGDALDELGEKGKNIRPVFISVDPDRDTPQELANYVSHFHPRMIGLTGAKDQLLSIADDYGATYFKVYMPPSGDESDDDGKGSAKGEYLINHSAATYLMGPDGKFITLFAYGVPTQTMVQEIRSVLQKAGE